MELAIFIIVVLILGCVGAIVWGVGQLKSKQTLFNQSILVNKENENLALEISTLKAKLDETKGIILQKQNEALDLEKHLSTFEEKINWLQKHLKDKESALQKANDEHEKALSKYEKQQEERFKNIEDKHQQMLKNIDEKYQQTLSNEREKSEQALRTIKIEYEKSLETLETKLKAHYKEQNQAILNQHQNAINKDSRKMLDEIFMPIKKSVDEYSKHLSQNETSLKTNIENMFKYSQQIGQEANKFAKILKGDKKMRGDFGEWQLKSVLESSGLIEGEQYFLQEDVTHKDDEERTKHYRPDAIVRIDKHRDIVIDAKFSLPNMDFSEISGNEINEIGKKELAKNLRMRIDELAKKPYSTKNDTYEYVLLFIPYQNILDLVLSVDSGIYKYAESKKIYLATPHTLFMALKTISITWRHIQSDQNIQNMLEEIGKAYDKFVGVLEDFKRIKHNISTLQTNVNNMDTKLTSGTGSMAKRFEDIKNMGVKTNKAIGMNK